jgi:hypothetical protein
VVLPQPPPQRELQPQQRLQLQPVRLQQLPLQLRPPLFLVQLQLESLPQPLLLLHQLHHPAKDDK